MKVTILGGGAWGTTLAQALADKENEVLVYDINKEFVEKINKRHLHPFFDITIPEVIKATDNLQKAVAFSDTLVLCVPTKVTRSVLHQVNELIETPKLFINVSKGIEPETSKRVSEIVAEEISTQNLKGYVVLSGPSHAEEMIFRKFTSLVSASSDLELAKFVQELFANSTYLRIYTSSDVTGVETCGAIKNAIALISGIMSGYGLGENARAALISRGMLEIIRIVEALGGCKETAYGLSGLGDLIVTASSLNSRNFQAGLRIGQGQSVTESLNNSKQTVEGIRALEAAYYIGKAHNLELPLIETAYALIFGNLTLDECAKALLKRKLKAE